MENLCHSASQPPENSSSFFRHRFLSSENHPQTPLITNQAIESAFSKLTLSSVLQPHAQTPSFSGLLEEEQQQDLFCAQSQSDNGGVNGPFGFFGAHQNINVGPETVGFSGRSPYLDDAGYHNLLRLMNYNNQRRDLFDASCDNYNFASFLHGRKTYSRKSYNQSNFASSSHSLYCSPELNHLQQQLSLEFMKGRIVPLATHRIWSGILNSKLEKLTEQEIDEIVLPEVLECLGDLMRSQFGSNFVCKLFDACNEDQRSRIILALSEFPVLISICFTSYGAKAMIKLLEKLNTPQQIYFVVSSLSLGARALVTDTNGQLVVQFCVKNFPGEYNKPLFIEIANNCIRIATNRSGCCVIQLCIEKSYGEARNLLIREVVANALDLAEDPFGNYVVQFVLALGIQDVALELVRVFHGHFMSFSRNKYASNVVEKLLEVSGEDLCAIIIMDLLKSPDVSMLLLDPFGNFVIQKALRESKGKVRDALVSLIQVNATFMQSNLYGKKILAWFGKRQHNITA